jgi:hypothetical protein
MPAMINFDDIPADKRKDMGLKAPRKCSFGREELRSWSLKVLALMSSLTRTQRERVLRHASKVNAV